MVRSCDIDAGTVRRVDWLELIPATFFFRAFAATFKPSFLLLCAAFALVCGRLDSFMEVDSNDYRVPELRIESMANGDQDVGLAFSSLIYSSAPARRAFSLFRDATPRADALNKGRTEENAAVFAVHSVEFLVALWLALAVARSAVVRLTTSSRSSTFASLKFAFKRYPSALLTLVAPLIFVAAFAVLALVARRTIPVSAVFSPVVMLLALAFEFILALLILSAPLGVAAVASENCDGFDAISRGVSYLIQRSLIWLLYAFFAQILICAGSFLLAFIARYAASGFVACYTADGALYDKFCVEFWGSLILYVPQAYPYVAAIVYSCAIYVMLRRSVDGTPFETCALNLKGATPRKLRKILKDEKGAPTFDSQNVASRDEKSSEQDVQETGGLS